MTQQLQPVVNMLQEAQISIAEACSELKDYVDNLEIDPLKMQQTELRYSKAIELARKHTVQPESLYEHHAQLKAEYQDLFDANSKGEQLKEELQQVRQDYTNVADRLHKTRDKGCQTTAKTCFRTNQNHEHARCSI